MPQLNQLALVVYSPYALLRSLIGRTSTTPWLAAGQRAAAPVVDVAVILDGLAAKNSEKLDWKHSIVDLMKLVGMDSSLGARKQLATELRPRQPGRNAGYAAGINAGVAAMANAGALVWLLRRRLDGLGGRRLPMVFAKIVIAATVMAAIDPANPGDRNSVLAA